MQFELCLEPEESAHVTRLALFAQNRVGRGRPQKRRTIWHDSPDRALAGAGLACAEERGIWRLERLLPGPEDWPPAAPSPMLTQGASPNLGCAAMPEALSPFAAFEGQVTEYRIETDQGAVVLQRLRGVLRTVAAERATARVLLSGPDAAVLTAAQTIAEALTAWVPRCSLAAEALAAADGRPPAARRTAAPILPGKAAIGDAFAYVLGHLTDVILYHAPFATRSDGGPEPIHQMRVAVRRLRSAIAIFRTAVDSQQVNAVDAALKELAQRLGPARDWDVFVTETAPHVAAALLEDARLARLLKAAERRRADAHVTLADYLGGPAFRQLGIELSWLAGARQWHETLDPAERDALGQDLAEFAARVLQRRSKRMRAAGENIHGMETPALHELRLRTKRLRYAAEILAPLFPAKPARRFIARLAALQTRLGVFNDGAVAAHLMEELGGAGGRHGYAVGLVTGYTAAGAASIRPRIVRAWEKFQRQAPFWP